MAARSKSRSITLGGEGGDDNFSINGQFIAPRASAETPEIIVSGGAPDAAGGGNDTLLFNPGDPTLNILPNDDVSSDDIGIDPAEGNFGALFFIDIETKTVLAAPQIGFVDPGPLDEGSDLSLAVNIVPNGTGDLLSENLVWTINGSRFTVIGNRDTTQTLSLSWEFLSVLYGVDDDGVYQISAHATNGSGFSATETFDLVVVDVAPVVNLAAEATARANENYAIGFSTTDVTADTPVSWTVDWGDSSVETYGAGANAASHVFSDPDVYTVTVSVLDDDGVTASAQQTVTVAAPDVDAGGPYVIAEGTDLHLSATPVGTPTDAVWDLDGDGQYDDATGLDVTVTWAELVALGIDDDLSDQPIAVQVSYAVDAPVTDATTLSVTNVAPTADGLSNNAGSGVDEGSDGSTVLISFVNPTDAGDGDVASLTYSYDFDSDGTFDRTGAGFSANVPAAYLVDDGRVVVTARISDGDGAPETM